MMNTLCFSNTKGVSLTLCMSSPGYVISDLLFVTSVNLEINCESVFAALDWLGSLTGNHIRVEPLFDFRGLDMEFHPVSCATWVVLFSHDWI
ncbi:hypothetical protein ABKN59_010477 [Abortiporus biennis]